MYYLTKKYLKHETIWRQNVLLKQKVMLISRRNLARLSSERDKRRTDRSVDGSADTVF